MLALKNGFLKYGFEFEKGNLLFVQNLLFIAIVHLKLMMSKLLSLSDVKYHLHCFSFRKTNCNC